MLSRRLLAHVLAWVCGLTLATTNTWAADKRVDVARLGDTAVSLTEFFAVLEDPGQTLSLADVQSPEIAARFTTGQAAAWSLKFGVTSSAYWLRLNLDNATAEPVRTMLEFSYPRLASSIQFFQPDGGGGYSRVDTGYLMPFAQRPYKHRFYVFPVSVPAHTQQVLYLRLQSTVNLEIPAQLWEREAFHRHERADYMGQAAYFGMVLIMLLFNLLLYFGLRDANYLWYVAFGISAAFSIAADNGLAIEYVWGNAPVWTQMASSVGYSVSLAIGGLFLRRMVGTRTLVPGLDKVLLLAVALHLVLPIGVAVSYVHFIKPLLLAGGVTSLLFLAVGLVCAFKRNRSAMFFVAAFGVMALGSASTSLRALGVLPPTLFSTHGIQIGSALEMLLLAFALADRYNVIRMEKAQAQFAALQAQTQLVENLQSSERLLESRVAQRTDELEVLNAKLQALSTTDALTGLANRRQFDEVLHSEWRRAVRGGQALSIGFIDVDWFKSYNDHYGHQAGDACLRQVADVLASTICRSGDLVARYGGEEFVFVAPLTDGIHALAMARKACEALQALTIPHAKSEFACVTASIGVATVVPSKDQTPDMLVKAADQALYHAKKEGRNRVSLSA
ncbi:MAG: diguanylate cyclase [Pseudomonadota bacterium]